MDEVGLDGLVEREPSFAKDAHQRYAARVGAGK
jgi:hypothetical protein